MPRVSSQNLFVIPAYVLFSHFGCALVSFFREPSAALHFDLTPFVIRIALADAQILQLGVGMFAKIAQSTRSFSTSLVQGLSSWLEAVFC